MDTLDWADVSLVYVGTPLLERIGTDLSYVGHAVEDIVAPLAVVQPPASGHHSVVIHSTVPPGTGEYMPLPALSDSLAGREVANGAAMCPEFHRLALGSPTSSPRLWSDLPSRQGMRRCLCRRAPLLTAFQGPASPLALSCTRNRADCGGDTTATIPMFVAAEHQATTEDGEVRASSEGPVR